MEMERLTTASLMFVAFVLPGFFARAAASPIIPPSAKQQPWTELMHSVSTAIAFWAFTALGGFMLLGTMAPSEILSRQAPVKSALVLVVAGVLAIGVVVLSRAFVPQALWHLERMFPSTRVPLGDRSPWLTVMDKFCGENRIRAVTKSGVVYLGAAFIVPRTEEHDSIVLSVEEKSMLIPDQPHRHTDLLVFDENATPMLVALKFSEIVALEVFLCENEEDPISREEDPLGDEEEELIITASSSSDPVPVSS